MICPVCNTNNIKQPDVESCSQCGADLKVYDLLYAVHNGVQMKIEQVNLSQEIQKKLSKIFIVFHVIAAILLLSCALFGIVVGMKLLSLLDQTRQVANIAKSEIGLKEWQQLSNIIEQELNLIIEQRKENQYLQTKVQELTTEILKTAKNNVKEEVNEFPKD